MRGLEVWKAISFCWLISAAAGLFSASDANAQTSCGFLRCEEYIIPNPQNLGYGLQHKECRQGTGPNADKIEYWNRLCWAGGSCDPWNYSGTTFALCNCAAQPNDDQPSKFGSPTGAPKFCKAGCTFVPLGGYSTRYPDITGNTSGSVIHSPPGWRPDGSQCNPLAPDAPSQEPPPEPNCDNDQCISSDDHYPPKFCVEHQGKQVCVGPDDGPCAGDNAKGYLCLGNPPPDPPPPPETKPDPNNPSQPAPPAASGSGSGFCNGAGACVSNSWEYTEGGAGTGGGDPPDDPDDPGTGPGGIGGPNVCPDGSAPQGGRCPAPVMCPGGTAPVNGRCPSATNCPVGTTPTGTAGQCAPTSGTTCPPGSTQVGNVCQGTVTCPNGATPDANNTCPGTVGTCPNGAQPVNGQCDITSACDPETDPNQCQGQEEGNAGGGQTCGAAPFCSGDPVVCQVLHQQWRTRCQLELTYGTDSDVSMGGEADPGPYDPNAVFEEGDGDGWFDQLDASGWLAGSSCPQFEPIEVMGTTIDFGQIDYCWIFAMMHALVLAAAYFRAAQIIGSA